MDIVNYRLVCAAREGRLESARELINSFGLNYSKAWSKGYVLLCDALKNNHTEVAKLLLTSGSKVNSDSIEPSDTALHFAAINGDITIVKMILDNGAIINAKNQYGRTPLYNAIQYNNKKMDIIDLLVKHGANINARENDGSSPLHVAIEKGCSQIIEYLLKYGADVNCVVTSSWRNGYAPLHLAVENGNKEAVTLLLSKGANVDAKEEDSLTPLHIAAKNGYTHIAEDLLNHGANIHSLTLKEGYRPLHFASKLNNEEAVKLFLNRGANVNANTNDNLTPLHIATKTGCNTVIKLLLKHGAKVNNQDKDGTTILYDAVKTGNLTIVQDILKYCPDINNRNNRSSITKAVHGGGQNYKNILEALLDYGLIFNPEEANNPELFHAAVKKGYLKIVEDLLRYGDNLNSSIEGFTPLHSAAQNKQAEVAKLLISYEADINADYESGKSPIFYAIENADLEMTELFLMNRANVKNNPRLLNVAVTKECTEIVEGLLKHGADINASDECGKTALYFTASSESILGFHNNSDPVNSVKGAITKLLLRNGAKVNSKTKTGSTALHAATEKEYAKVVETLLEYNANVNSKAENGITPLHFAAQKGNEEIVRMLLNKGANVNATQIDGTTALHIATYENVVKLLLQYGAKVDVKMKNDITPLYLAAQKGYQEVVEEILKFGADVDSRDEDGKTALHIASQEGYHKVVATLLEYGSDINLTSRNNYTPLDYATIGLESFYNSVEIYVSSVDDNDYDDNYFYTDIYESRDRHYYDRSDNRYYNLDRKICVCRVTEALKCHIVKMKTANLCVSENNNFCLISEHHLISMYERWNFQNECKVEIPIMKSEKINNTNISFYDVLTKNTSALTIYMRNEDIVQVLKSEDYKTKFPIYASMIKTQFRKSMERKELLEQSKNIFYFIFPKLVDDCTEKIFSYLSIKDLKNLINACNPLGISNAYTNINDEVEN